MPSGHKRKMTNKTDIERNPIFTDENIETLFKVRPPLQQLPEGYFGYAGVLLRNKLEDKLQCHICGKWRKSLSNHVNLAHKILSREYKKKFSLPMAFPLVGRSVSAAHSKRALKPENLERLHKVRKPIKVSTRRRKEFMKYAMGNMALLNKRGICEEQIDRRFEIVADIVGREPSTDELREHDGSLWGVIRRKFQTINQYRKRRNLFIRPAYSWKTHGMTEQKALACLRKFYQKNKRVPKAKDFRNGMPTETSIRKKFGSWHRALEMAGFDSK